ncbi:MAG: glycosyltransferase [Anaerolineales bacterium]|jgi:glycosyltransferase involved in cell wall biosynthesis
MRNSGQNSRDHPAQAVKAGDANAADQPNEDYLAGKKIAIIIQSLAIGGAERVTLNLVKGFIQHGIRIDLLLADYSGGLLSEIPSQVTIIDLKGKRVLFSLFPLVRYLRTQRPDLLFSIQAHTSLIAVWAVRLARVQTPLVISLQTVLSTSLASEPSLSNRLIKILSSLFFRYADAAICISQGVADDFIKTSGMPPQKTHVVYNPVVYPGLEQEALQTISHPWFTSGNPPLILAVGRLALAKDYPTLLRAFSLVCQKRTAHLLILGEGRERPRLEVLVRQLGLAENVQMPGFVKNPFAYISRARLLVLSSKWEGFGNVLVEALACGTPVVSTNCIGGPREILADGRFGRLVPVGDSEALAAAMLETLQKPQDRAMLRQRAQDFTVEKSVKEYLRIFQSCLLSHEQ